MADIFVRDNNLIDLMEKTGYNITQENGQRKFGPPPGWIGSSPPKGSEIFIGKLPRNVFEDELVPLCQQFGKIYELRLMMDFNGENRGYAFVTYTNTDDATKAIKHLDDFEIRPGRHIGVCKSIDNCRLFVGGIPKDKSKDEIMDEISNYTEGVSKVILYSSIADKTKNRGFAFIEYETHRAAAMARRKLHTTKIKLFDHEIAVDWAQPEAQVEESTMRRLELSTLTMETVREIVTLTILQKFLRSVGKRQFLPSHLVTVLYVRNLSNNTTEEQLHVVFSMGGAIKLDRVKKLRDFAFIHYCRREDAEAALERFNGMILDDCAIEVTWAKPPEAQKQKLLMEKTARACLNRQLCYDNFDHSFEINMPLSSPLSPSLLSRSNFRQRMQLSNISNFSGTLTVTKPIQLLFYLCAENAWGTPLFQVNRIDSDPSEICYICWITIPNLPTQVRRFMSDKICRSSEEARHYAACHILKKFGVIDADFPFIGAAPHSLPGVYPSMSKNYLSTSNSNVPKSASSLGLCTSPTSSRFQSFKTCSPFNYNTSPNFFCERGQGDAGSFPSGVHSMNSFSDDDIENCAPLLDPETPIEPTSLLGLLSSLAAASNVDLPLFNKPKL